MTVPLWLLPSPDPLIRFSVFFLFSTIISIGLLLNVFVIYRMLRLLKQDRQQFLNGTGVFLCVMAGCDMTSLISIYSQFLITLIGQEFPEVLLMAFCKATEFIARVAFTQSMYCWLCMSTLRYVAALHPMAYSTIWRSPTMVLCSVATVSLILNLHVFVSIQTNDRHQCVLVVDTMSSVYNMADVLLSFTLPFSLIFWMDLRILCCRPHRRQSDPLLQVVFHKVDEETEKMRLANMRRFMSITLVSLILSFPENTLRALRVLIPTTIQQPMLLSPLMYYTVKMLYFAKFSFNAFYLTAYVFDRNVLSKTSSSRQLSVSIRRLEDNPSIIPRERSNTVSYRATTPVPVLTRNSSCILLEQDGPKDWV